MYKVVCFVKNRAAGGSTHNVYQPVNSQGYATNDFKTLADAKKAAEALLMHPTYITHFNNGYEFWILDSDSGLVAGRAVQEIKPILKWEETEY